VPAPTPDRATVEAGRPEEESGRKRPRWHDSTLTFDQSVTTQTVGIGADYQSANPTYEWWLAFRPNYFLYEDARQSFSIKAWANLYYELTNSDTTTYQNEASIGPTFLWLPYARTLFEGREFKTSVSIGPRFSLPTDKASRLAGQYLTVGAIGGLSEQVPLAGKQAGAFQNVRLGLEATYSHPITRATTPVSGSLERTRQDLGGRTFLSDQLSPGTNINHALNVYFSADLSLLKNLNFDITYVLLNSWIYGPSEGRVCTLTGCVEPQGLADPSTFRPSTWLVASLDYDPIEDVTLSLGYYNRATQLGPSGERRNVLWSPEARFFLSVIGKLDAIYDRLRSKDVRQVSQR
jgi:hypothetical protein